MELKIWQRFDFFIIEPQIQGRPSRDFSSARKPDSKTDNSRDLTKSAQHLTSRYGQIGSGPQRGLQLLHRTFQKMSLKSQVPAMTWAEA